MGYYSGNSGKIQFANTNQITDGATDQVGWRELPIRVSNWSMNSSVQLLETTSLGDWDRTTEYGVRSHTGSMSLLYYTEDMNAQSSPSNNAASWFIGALTMASSQVGAGSLGQYRDQGEYKASNSPINVRLRLFLRDTSTAIRDYIDFEARITSVGYGSAVNEITAVDVNFEASGQIIKGNL